MTRERPPARLTTSGEPVELALPESPTTGYRWELEHSGDAVRVLSSSYRDEPEARQLAGGGGTRTFRLELLHPGDAELAFVLRRPGTPEPLERQVVTITAGAP